MHTCFYSLFRSVTPPVEKVGLENGRVGEVLVEKSAGYQDLDFSAAEAVKKWLFEPARRGKEPVQVWVLLPVKFELH